MEDQQSLYLEFSYVGRNLSVLYFLIHLECPKKITCFLDLFSFNVRYSTQLHLQPLRFNCVGGSWDRTQEDCCDLFSYMLGVKGLPG
jgi:hypothetical protein